MLPEVLRRRPDEPDRDDARARELADDPRPELPDVPLPDCRPRPPLPEAPAPSDDERLRLLVLSDVPRSLAVAMVTSSGSPHVLWQFIESREQACVPWLP